MKEKKIKEILHVSLLKKSKKNSKLVRIFTVRRIDSEEIIVLFKVNSTYFHITSKLCGNHSAAHDAINAFHCDQRDAEVQRRLDGPASA